MINSSDDFLFEDSAEERRKELLRHLKEESDVLRSESLEDAFENVDRKDFVPGDYLFEAYEDYALPLSDVSTISQPTTVAFMLELLEVESGEKVLDVGSGSCWTTALIAHLVGQDGFVLGLEIDNSMREFGENNLKKYSFKHVKNENPREVIFDDESFDKILFSAKLEHVPSKFIYALRDGGLLLAPVDDSLVLYRKQGETLEEIRRIEGFTFVSYRYDETDN